MINCNKHLPLSLVLVLTQSWWCDGFAANYELWFVCSASLAVPSLWMVVVPDTDPIIISTAPPHIFTTVKFLEQKLLTGRIFTPLRIIIHVLGTSEDLLYKNSLRIPLKHIIFQTICYFLPYFDGFPVYFPKHTNYKTVPLKFMQKVR